MKMNINEFLDSVDPDEPFVQAIIWRLGDTPPDPNDENFTCPCPNIKEQYCRCGLFV